MLRLLAVEVMHGISMMFLNANKANLLIKMDANINSAHLDYVHNHRIKIRHLSETMSSSFPPAKAYQRFKRALGHNLFVKAIMAISKTGKHKTTFAKGISEGQWNNFVNYKTSNGRDKPLPSTNAFYGNNLQVSEKAKLRNLKNWCVPP
jgi:hypothetical protein